MLKKKPCYLKSRRSQGKVDHPLFLVTHSGPDTVKERRPSELFEQNSPSATARPPPATATLIQTRRHNLLLSLRSSTGQGRGGNQTNGGRQKGHFHLDLADSSGEEERREKLSFNVKDMKGGSGGGGSGRLGRRRRLHLRERQTIKEGKEA